MSPFSQSNLTKALAENRPSAPLEAPSAVPEPTLSEETTLPSPQAASLERVTFPPLSSSPQPAFLPVKSSKAGSAFNSGSISGRSKTTYVGRRGIAIQVPPKDDASIDASVDFTNVSAGSFTREQRPRRPSQRASSRRVSLASSSPSSAALNRKGPTGRASATLASSFVSSLGRTTGKEAGATIGSRESISRSSPSVDLLRRFSHAVESNTGSPLPSISQGN